MLGENVLIARAVINSMISAPWQDLSPPHFMKLKNFFTGQTLMMSSGSAHPRRACETP
jgi:hypothetical protein